MGARNDSRAGATALTGTEATGLIRMASTSAFHDISVLEPWGSTNQSASNQPEQEDGEHPLVNI